MARSSFTKKKFTNLPSLSQKKKIRDLWQDYLHSFLEKKSRDTKLFESTLSTTKEWLGWMDDLGFVGSSKKQIHKINYNFSDDNISKKTLFQISYDFYLFFCIETKVGSSKQIIDLANHYNNQNNTNKDSVSKKIPWSFCLWNLRSSHNVGSIVRTIECMGLESVYLAGYTCGSEIAGFRSAAMGTEKNVELIPINDSFDDLHAIANGKKIIALEIHQDAIEIEEFNWHDNSKTGGIVVVGNEELGLPEEILSRCDAIVNIPLYGKKESLNVANACSICAWEIRKSFISSTTFF